MNKNRSLSRFITPVALIMTTISFLSSAAHAQVIVAADFTGGNGTTSVDQFQGIAGGGWSNAWSLTGSGYAGSVESTTPIDGNYLNIDRPSTSIVAGALTRSINNSMLDTANNHVVKFSIRLDTLATGQTMSIGGYSLGASSSWNWLITGDTARWGVYNNLTIVNTTVAPVAGHTYDFTVNTDMAAKQWTMTIQDGASSYTSGTLNFRNTSAVNDERLLFSMSNANATNLNVSFDKISYSAVPEPGITALLLVAGAFLLLRPGKARQTSRI